MADPGTVVSMVLGFVISLAGIVEKVIQGEVAQSAMTTQLDILHMDHAIIMQQLGIIFREVQWNSVIAQAHEHVERIDFLYERLYSLGIDDDATELANAILDPLNGVEFGLEVIHDIMMGTSVFGSPPLLKTFADRINSKSISQSPKWTVNHYLSALIELQGKGYLLVANAYSLKKKSYPLRSIMHEKLTKQTDLSISFLDKLDNWYIPKARTPTYNMYEGNHAVDLKHVKAKDGNIVVGVRMYRKGGSTPRLALEIAEAKPQSQNRIVAPVKWTRNRDWGGVIYVDYYNAVNDFSFIHLQATHIPDGCAVTGMAFHKYNNRLGIMLQYRKIDFNTGLMSGPRRWQLPQGWGQTEGTHYIGDQQWTPNAEIGDVLPNPKAWVTGASLYKKTDKTMALKLRILYE